MQQLKSMASDRKLANAVGGKTARACDNCVRKRARWYCAADDAFLCQSCDSSVHSANSLARRHERVRLKVAPINSFDGNDDESRQRLLVSVPSWHQGFTRRARTPRQKKHGKLMMMMSNPLHLVPEICSEEQSHEENEEQLLYRVPIFDPFEVAANPAAQNDAENTNRFMNESKAASNNEFSQEMKLLEGILPSELDLAEFAADVESLLGKGLDDESFDMEGLGILGCDGNGKESKECSLLSERIKVEEEEVGEVDVAEENHQIDVELDVGRETFELSFDYGSPITCEEEDQNKALNQEPIFKNNFEECKVNSDYKSFLKLDYEGVMSAWDDQKSPWTTGERPELNSGDCWPDCLGTSGTMHVHGDMGTMSGHAAAAAAGMADGGREARVSRYREKRRTRLFSKKIRYEVRKLNAEKRPRMKGRFVKRANFAASAFPLLK